MSQTAYARTTVRSPLRFIAAGLVVVTAAVIGTVLQQLEETTSSSSRSLGDVYHGGPGAAATPEADGPVTEADGDLPDGVSVFDNGYPGVANLDVDLLRALRAATAHAAADGIEVFVNSGWRSPDYQDELLREAVSEYGSAAEAARWVATADTSPHVSGNAVDIGSFDAMAWMSEHGAEYGLCRIYANESWHYELRPEAIDRGCPPMYDDPTHDPRMQR